MSDEQGGTGGLDPARPEDGRVISGQGRRMAIPDMFGMTIPNMFGDPPVLRTERLVLRQVTGSDGEGQFGIFAEDQVTEHYAWDTFADIAQGHALAVRTAEQFRRREAVRWGLVLPGSAQIIGTCGYTRWSQQNHFAVIGYDLARRYWRRGLMSEAVAAVLRFGFEQVALHRVEATVLTGNAASAALLDRAGFQREGVLRGRALHRGTFRDVQMFGLNDADWAAAAAAADAPATGGRTCG